MASSLSSSPLLFASYNVRGERRGDAVYVAAVPLRAAKGPAQLVLSSAYSAGLWDLQHFMVAVKPQDSSYSAQAFVFDFKPQDPEDFYVAVTALFRRQVPGVVLKRKVTRLPKSRCWFVGFSCPNSVDVADIFNENWDTDLILGERDCRHYTNGLVEHLTGKQGILGHLRGTFHG